MRFVIPARVVTEFHIRPGDAVGDFGAGSGYFTPELSKAAGAEGRVYAFEIQKPLVETLANLVRERHLGNVEVVWCDIEEGGGCKIADGALDVGVVVNTLSQMEDKETALDEMTRLIRKGGRFFIIDWTDSYGGMGPKAEQIVTEWQARDIVEKRGCVFERTFSTGEHHYGLGFRKS